MVWLKKYQKIKKLAEDAGKGQFEKIKQGLLTLFGSGSGLCKTGAGNGRTQKPDYREDESVYCPIQTGLLCLNMFLTEWNTSI